MDSFKTSFERINLRDRYYLIIMEKSSWKISTRSTKSMCLLLSRNETFATTFNRRDGTRDTRRNEKFKALKLEVVLDIKARGADFIHSGQTRYDSRGVSRFFALQTPFQGVCHSFRVIYPPCILAPCIDLTLLKTIVAYRMIKRKKKLKFSNGRSKDLLIWSII